MKGFLKKSIQSARKSKSPGQPGRPEEPFIRRDTTLVDLTAQTAHEGPNQVDSEANSASSTQLTTREGVDSEAEASTEIALPSGAEVARRQLFKASKDLEEIICLYFSSDSVPTGISEVYANIKAPSLGKDGFDADNLANLLTAIVSCQYRTYSSLSSKVSSAFGKIYPLANIITRLGVATGDVFPPVKATMGGLSVLFSIAETERVLSEDFIFQLQRITYQSSRISELRKTLCESEMGDSLVERSTHLLTAIIVYFKDSIIYLRHGHFYNLGKVLVQGEQVYSDAKRQLESAIQEYDQALLLHVAISTLSTRARHDQVDDNTSRVPADIIRWLDSAYWETEAQYSSHNDRRDEGSMLWLLDMENFKKWRADESSRLWLTAPPGVGKSILAAYLVRLLKAESPEAVVLYFFCSAANAKLNTIGLLIRTLAAQIVRMIPDSLQHFRKLKDEGFESEDCSLLFKKLVHEPLSRIQRTTHIVIDGLDECLAGDDAPVIGNPRDVFLRNLQRTEAKIVLISRPMCNASEHVGPCLHHHITSENMNDIRAYISRRLAQSPVLRKGFDRLQEKEPETFMSEKAQGNFLWVAVLLGLLEKRSVSVQAFQAGIDNIPDSLGQVYDQLLDRLDGAGTLDLAKVILSCLLCSMSPLTIESLHAATAVLYEDVIDFQEFIQLECGSFLKVIPTAEGSGIVQVVHETFKSYIMNDDALGDRGLSREICHLQLATVCLESLTSEDGNAECLRDYAAEHWLAHFVAFRATAGNQTPECEQLTRLFIKLHDFLTNDIAFGTWIKRCIFIIEEDIRMRYFLFRYETDNQRSARMAQITRSGTTLPRRLG